MTIRRLFPRAATAGLLALLCLLATIAPVVAHEPIEAQIVDLSRRIEAHPADALLYLRRGELYRLLRRGASARADYERARRLDAGLVVVDLCLGKLQLDAGRPAEAVASLDTYLKRRPGDPEGLAARGRALARLGRFLEAARDFTGAIAGSRPARPPSPDLYLERARALESAGDTRLEEALRGLEDGLALLGRPVALELAAADLERRLGRPGAAEERVSRITCPAPVHPGPTIPSHAEFWRATRDSGVAGDSAGGGAGEAGAETQSPLSLKRGPYLQRGTSDGIVVRWRTDREGDAVVRYGPAPDDLRLEARDARALRDHEIPLSGLAPATRYYYSAGTSTQTLAGGAGELSFVTAPAPGTRSPVRIWALGDSGTADLNARRVRDAFRAFAGGGVPDVWLMLGDNAYPNGTDAEYQAAVFDVYDDLLARAVLWPTLGNHDGQTADSATQSGPYYDIFTLPSAGEAGGLPSGTEAYYSFDYADLHFICLDSYETDRSPLGAMMTWLRADALSTRQDWTIAFWHHPPYSKGSHDSDREIELVQMRQAALPILEAAGVDLVLTGHSHSYERSFLLDGHYGSSFTLAPAMKKDSGDGRADGSGAYAKPTAGPAGHEGAVYVVAGSSGQTSGGPLNHPAMYLSLNELGSLVLDVNGLRLDATFLDASGLARDHFTLLKGPQNRQPVADARVPGRVECDSHQGGTVRLDGSRSSDPDEGAGDRIVLYEWFEAYGTPAVSSLGTGPLLEVTLAPGDHALTLRVTDTYGASGTDQALVSVVDTIPPVLDLALDPAVLWPPDHGLHTVRIRYSVTDACDPSPGVTLARVTSSEADDAAGGGDGASLEDIQGAVLENGGGEVELRAERAATGPGRTYTVTCSATDAAGLTTTVSGTVLVPHDRRSAGTLTPRAS